MKLDLHIIQGQRKGVLISLPLISKTEREPMLWVREDEAIEFRLKVPKKYKEANLEIYQHIIPATDIQHLNHEETVEFIWTPQKGRYQEEKLFRNYFGIAEINVLVVDELGEELELLCFQSIHVVAKVSSADKVESMFEYLAGVSSEALHSVFSATRHGVGFNEGKVSPSYTLERIEHSIDNLKINIPLLLNRPITRLVPEHRILPTSGNEELDDSSIGWLLENLSILEPDEHPDRSHIDFEGQHYRAPAVRRSVLIENSDVYENQVIHGFLELLLVESQQLGQRYIEQFNFAKKLNDIPKGYISFFEKISRFKSQLIGAQSNRIEKIILAIKQMKSMLEHRLPVTRLTKRRPIFTPKTRNNYAYRDIFVEIVKWHERGEVDWTAYENLFAIESIPTLFESYCYFRVVESLNRYFVPIVASNTINSTLKLEFIDDVGNEIFLEREPEYWTMRHSSKHKQGIVNSEGYTLNIREQYYSFHSRSQSGDNSKRQPDIVIQIIRPNREVQLLVIDAKYTSSQKAFIHYLPELTMKYVHGIHLPRQEKLTVTSLTILFPDNERAQFISHHHKEMGVFGDHPVEPNLQALGLILDSKREEDTLTKLIFKLLEINGIHLKHTTELVT